MKVAIDISPLKTGHNVRGIGTYTQNLVKEFKKREYKNIEFKFFASPTSPPPVDLVHYPYLDLFFHTLPVKSKMSRVVTIHDVIPLMFPDHFPKGLRGNINLFLQKLALKNVDAIICDSETSKQDILDKLSVPKEKIHVVYLAPSKKFKKIESKEELETVSKKYKLPSKFALYVGDVNWSKNIPNLLKAISKSEANLAMVGKAIVDESLTEVREINKLITDLNIENRVFRTGFVKESDLAAIYNLASVTVLPSFYEGFGLPVLESMACGTPVVCSKVASLSEISQEVAVFCNPNDPTDISHKIINTMQNNSQEFSNKLIAHASKFTWAKTAKKILDIYNLLA